jgi:outer membrane protein
MIMYKTKILLLSTFFLLFSLIASGQEIRKAWTLHDCIEYALEHNIQVKRSNITRLSGKEDMEQAKARLFPSLSASVSQNVTNYPSSEATNNTSWSGNYSVNASWTVFDAGRRTTTIRQQALQDEINSLGIEQSGNDIQISLVQVYMQVLYSHESVGIAENTVDVSKAQLDRAAELLKAGAISRVDYAQLESQYSTSKYQLVVARKNLDNYRLQLKQLLELDVTDEMEISIPEFTDNDVMKALPDKASVYAATLAAMPEMKSGALNIDIARLEIQKAKAGFYPSLSLNAALGTGHASGAGATAFGSQIWNRFNENIGLSLNIPIYSNRDSRTAVNKAKHAVITSELNLQSAEKTLLRTVEGIYLDATSAQNQYIAAVERLNYVSESYRLTEEQFFLGMKNTLELLTEKNNLISARQELLQSKFMAIMSMRLLDIYQKLYINIIY